MSEISRPDFTYQWSSGGAIVAPSNTKIQNGWTSEVPPYQWENWSQNRQDNAITYLFQRGVSGWSSTQDYYHNNTGLKAYVQGSDGNIYVSTQSSTGQNPVADTSGTYWKTAFVTPESLATSLGNSSTIVSSLRNSRLTVTSPSTVANYTVDEVIVKSVLGGVGRMLANLSSSLNISTNGAGGMDIGSAPVNGDVAIYLIYNPSTNNARLMGKNATSVKATEVYSGGNMPSGYTASALVAVLKTDGAGQFKPCFVRDRWVDIQTVIILSTTVTNSTPTGITFAGTVPLNAVAVSAAVGIAATTGGATMIANLRPYSGSSVVGVRELSASSNAPGNGISGELGMIALAEPQRLYYTDATSAGSVSAFNISISGYQF